eukprot:2039286-Prymnesium_polylepis.1
MPRTSPKSPRTAPTEIAIAPNVIAVLRRFQDGEEYPYVDKSTGDKYYENFVVTPNGAIYGTRKSTRAVPRERRDSEQDLQSKRPRSE